MLPNPLEQNLPRRQKVVQFHSGPEFSRARAVHPVPRAPRCPTPQPRRAPISGAVHRASIATARCEHAPARRRYRLRGCSSIHRVRIGRRAAHPRAALHGWSCPRPATRRQGSAAARALPNLRKNGWSWNCDRSDALRIATQSRHLIFATRPVVGNFWNCSMSWPGTTRSGDPASSNIRACWAILAA